MTTRYHHFHIEGISRESDKSKKTNFYWMGKSSDLDELDVQLRALVKSLKEQKL